MGGIFGASWKGEAQVHNYTKQMICQISKICQNPTKKKENIQTLNIVSFLKKKYYLEKIQDNRDRGYKFVIINKKDEKNVVLLWLYNFYSAKNKIGIENEWSIVSTIYSFHYSLNLHPKAQSKSKAYVMVLQLKQTFWSFQYEDGMLIIQGSDDRSEITKKVHGKERNMPLDGGEIMHCNKLNYGNSLHQIFLIVQEQIKNENYLSKIIKLQ